jgi:hypothetical protein
LTTLAEDGFLSTETEAVIATVWSKYGTLLSELRALNSILVREQYGFNVHVESAREMTCAILYMRSLVHCQAAVLLIERGMSASGRAMIRCAIEALFCLAACASDPKAALEFLDADDTDRMQKAKYLAQVKDPKARETVSQSDLQTIVAHIKL